MRQPPLQSNHNPFLPFNQSQHVFDFKVKVNFQNGNVSLTAPQGITPPVSINGMSSFSPSNNLNQNANSNEQQNVNRNVINGHNRSNSLNSNFKSANSNNRNHLSSHSVMNKMMMNGNTPLNENYENNGQSKLQSKPQLKQQLQTATSLSPYTSPPPSFKHVPPPPKILTTLPQNNHNLSFLTKPQNIEIVTSEYAQSSGYRDREHDMLLIDHQYGRKVMNSNRNMNMNMNMNMNVNGENSNTSYNSSASSSYNSKNFQQASLQLVECVICQRSFNMLEFQQHLQLHKNKGKDLSPILTQNSYNDEYSSSQQSSASYSRQSSRVQPQRVMYSQQPRDAELLGMIQNPMIALRKQQNEQNNSNTSSYNSHQNSLNYSSNNSGVMNSSPNHNSVQQPPQLISNPYNNIASQNNSNNNSNSRNSSHNNQSNQQQQQAPVYYQNSSFGRGTDPVSRAMQHPFRYQHHSHSHSNSDELTITDRTSNHNLQQVIGPSFYAASNANSNGSRGSVASNGNIYTDNNPQNHQLINQQQHSHSHSHSSGSYSNAGKSNSGYNGISDCQNSSNHSNHSQQQQLAQHSPGYHNAPHQHYSYSQQQILPSSSRPLPYSHQQQPFRAVQSQYIKQLHPQQQHHPHQHNPQHYRSINPMLCNSDSYSPNRYTPNSPSQQHSIYQSGQEYSSNKMILNDSLSSISSRLDQNSLTHDFSALNMVGANKISVNQNGHNSVDYSLMQNRRVGQEGQDMETLLRQEKKKRKNKTDKNLNNSHSHNINQHEVYDFRKKKKPQRAQGQAAVSRVYSGGNSNHKLANSTTSYYDRKFKEEVSSSDDEDTMTYQKLTIAQRLKEKKKSDEYDSISQSRSLRQTNKSSRKYRSSGKYSQADSSNLSKTKIPVNYLAREQFIEQINSSKSTHKSTQQS